MRALIIAMALAAAPVYANENAPRGMEQFEGGSMDRMGGGLEGRSWIKALTGKNYWDMRSEGGVQSKAPSPSPVSTDSRGVFW